MWKNTIEPDQTRMTIPNIRFASWVTKATNTHSEYVIFIAIPLKKVVTGTRLNIMLCYVVIKNDIYIYM